MALAATIRLLESIKHKKECITDFCRVCMRQRSDMKCVFSAEGSRIMNELEFCTGLLVTKEDGLPTKLCDSCLSNLSIAHKFKSDCLQSNDILRKILQSSKYSIKQEVKKEVKDLSNNSKYKESVTKQEDTTQYSDGDDSQYSDDDDSQYSGDDDSQYSGYDDSQYSDGDAQCEFESRLKSQDLMSHDKNKEAEVVTKDKNINITKATSTTAKARNTTNLRYKYLNKVILKPEGLIGKEMNANKASKNTNPKKKRILKPLRKNKGRIHTKLYCADCDTQFDDHDIIVKHRKEVHGRELVCEICGKVFDLNKSLYNHLKTHQQRSYKCTECDYSTNDMSNLKKHMQTHDDNQYVCEYCSKTFNTSMGIRNHIKRHHKLVTGKQLPCPRCGKGFYTKYKLNRHLDSHDNIKRFKCEYCHSQYTRRCHLRMHLERVHDTTLPRFMCNRKTDTVNKPCETTVEKL